MAQEQTTPVEEAAALPEDMKQAVENMTPEQVEKMQEDMQKMQEEKLEEARKQQKEQIEMLSKVLTDFKPMFLDYAEKAIRTESDMDPFKGNHINPRIAHSIIGVTTELNELGAAVQLQDSVNIIEEMGDIFWYEAIAQDEIDFISSLDVSPESIEQIMLGDDKGYGVDVMDLLKRAMFYGVEFTKEECVKPYQSIYLGTVVNSLKLGIDLSVVIDTNLKKLYERYPDKFTKELAELRDTAAERKVMDDNVASESENSQEDSKEH